LHISLISSTNITNYFHVDVTNYLRKSLEFIYISSLNVFYSNFYEVESFLNILQEKLQHFINPSYSGTF